MKILVSSHLFSPSIGGVETVSAALAAEWTRTGNEVRVVTQSAGRGSAQFPFEIERRPAPWTLLALVRWCDVYFHNNISLQTAWPLLLRRRPWVIAHQTWLVGPLETLSWKARLKQRVLSYATNIAISGAISENLDVPSTIIGNPYQDELFYRLADAKRERDLVFLGRLVSDKGADLLIEALSLLKERGMHPTVSIVGDGPERETLEAHVRRESLAGQVAFAGALHGSKLAELLNLHQIMVVPSRWAEPFGIVALEGIACGCVLVGSSGGGLSDAIGPCGVTFPSGNAEALAAVIERILQNPEALEPYRRQAEEHLRRHQAAAVAAEYLQVFQRAVKQARRAGRR